MKVLLVGNYEADRQYSMLGFAACLARELPKLGIKPTVVAPRVRLSRLGHSSGTRKWLAYADKYLLFPKILRKAAAKHDVAHVLDHGNSMYVPHLPPSNHLVTCHDLLAMRAAQGEISGWHVGPSGRKYQDLIRRGLVQSHLVACVSQATADDVSRIIGTPKDRLRLVYNGQYQVLERASKTDLASVQKQHGIPERFLLHVGGDSIYKNRHGLIEIYRELYQLGLTDCPKLVVAGRPLNPEVLQGIEKSAPGMVTVVDSPSREQLSALYQLATALVFPSTYEGFGLPILEAQSLGCPVFTSNRSPMLEVGGNAAVYFDPEAYAEAAKTIAEHLDKLDEVSARGVEQSNNFSTLRMVQAYVDLYKELKS